MAKKGALSKPEIDEHGFYIKSLGILSNFPQRKMKGEQVLGVLQNRGINKKEIDDLGLRGLLSTEDVVNLDDVEAHIKRRKPKFELKTQREDDFDRPPTDYAWAEEILDEDSEAGQSEIYNLQNNIEENLESGDDRYEEDKLFNHLQKKLSEIGVDSGGNRYEAKGGPKPGDMDLYTWLNSVHSGSGNAMDSWIAGDMDFDDLKSSDSKIREIINDYIDETGKQRYLEDPLIEISMEGDEVGGKVVIQGKDDYGYTIEIDGKPLMARLPQSSRETPMHFDVLENARERATDEAFDRGYIEFGGDHYGYEDATVPGGTNYRVESFVLEGGPEYTRSHFDDNAMYHARLKDRLTPDGKGKLLYVEELQSDWAGEYRKGYMTPSTPEDNLRAQQLGITRTGYDDGKLLVKDPPFVTKTKDWNELAAKQLAAYAQKNGYDGIAYAPGQVHMDRWPSAKEGLRDQYDIHFNSAMEKVMGRKPVRYEDPEGAGASGSPMWIFDETDKQKIDQGFSQYVAPIGTGILTGAATVGGSLTPTQKAFSEAVNTPMPFERDSIFDLDPDALRAGREMMAGDTSGMISDAQRLYGLLSGYFTGEPIAETDKQADETQQAVYGALSEGAADDPGIQNYLGPLQEGEEAYQRALEEVTQPRFMGTYPLDEELYKTNPRLFRILNTIDQYGNPFHVEPNFQR